MKAVTRTARCGSTGRQQRFRGTHWAEECGSMFLRNSWIHQRHNAHDHCRNNLGSQSEIIFSYSDNTRCIISECIYKYSETVVRTVTNFFTQKIQFCIQASQAYAYNTCDFLPNLWKPCFQNCGKYKQKHSNAGFKWTPNTRVFHIPN